MFVTKFLPVEFEATLYNSVVSSVWSLLINKQGWRQLIDGLDFNKIESLHGTPERVSLSMRAR